MNYKSYLKKLFDAVVNINSWLHSPGGLWSLNAQKGSTLTHPKPLSSNLAISKSNQIIKVNSPHTFQL
ncbi:MAG: hypothetical protein U9P70_03660 [Patescibacteria group bacterium]|nr:hypothetical protein [Patescibacteria group bacterium]